MIECPECGDTFYGSTCACGYDPRPKTPAGKPFVSHAYITQPTMSNEEWERCRRRGREVCSAYLAKVGRRHA